MQILYTDLADRYTKRCRRTINAIERIYNVQMKQKAYIYCKTLDNWKLHLHHSRQQLHISQLLSSWK